MIGQSYSTIAWLPPLNEKGSWALPLRHERITSFESPLSKATWQLKQVCKKLPTHKPKLVVLDCEYGNGKFIQQSADIEISKLIRVRSNLCLYGNPEPYSGRGRPRKHGVKLKLNQCDDFPPAHEILEIEDSSLGAIGISKWKELHFYNAPSQKLTLFKIERLKEKKTGGLHRPLWLIWAGEEFLSSSHIWIQYSRRFGVDHWYRFAKQRLHWTLPHFRTPDKCQRWSNLIVNITWQLWLSKDLVREYHLPWQKPQQNLTPGRVALSMTSLLLHIGSPTLTPKTRGKSYGCSKGHKRSKATVYPTVKKRFSPTRKRRKR